MISRTTDGGISTWSASPLCIEVVAGEVATVVSVSVAVVGARPAVSLAAWVGVFASFGLTLLGPSFKLWDWALAISPFWHIPNVTDSDADWWGLFRISLVTVVLLAIGFVGFRRRDIAG